jgi:hypothetical protein
MEVAATRHALPPRPRHLHHESDSPLPRPPSTLSAATFNVLRRRWGGADLGAAIHCGHVLVHEDDDVVPDAELHHDDLFHEVLGRGALAVARRGLARMLTPRRYLRPKSLF